MQVPLKSIGNAGAALMIGVAVAMIFAAGFENQKRNWPTIQATVTGAEEKIIGGEDSDPPRKMGLFATYRYEIEKRPFTGTGWIPINSFADDSNAGYKRSHRIGDFLMVHYNPKAPAESTPEPDLNWRGTIVSAAFLFLCALGWRRVWISVGLGRARIVGESGVRTR